MHTKYTYKQKYKHIYKHTYKTCIQNIHTKHAYKTYIQNIHSNINTKHTYKTYIFKTSFELIVLKKWVCKNNKHSCFLNSWTILAYVMKCSIENKRGTKWRNKCHFIFVIRSNRHTLSRYRLSSQLKPSNQIVFNWSIEYWRDIWKVVGFITWMSGMSEYDPRFARLALYWTNLALLTSVFFY